MKKLLLVGAILALSATAMATGNTDTDTLTVSATYVQPITVSLNTASINFGEVYEDFDATVQSVIATITAKTDETFSYAVTTNGDIVNLGGDTTGTDIVATGIAQEYTFTVDLNTDSTNLTANVDETVSINVNYTSIDSTVVIL